MTEEVKDEKIVEDRGDSIPTGDDTGDTVDKKTTDSSVDAGDKDAEAKAKEEAETKAKEKADAEDKDTKKDKEKDIQIPKARFDKAVAKARKEAEEAQKRADDLQEKLDVQQGTANIEKIEETIDELEEKLEDAIKDGNGEAKLRLRKEIRKLNQEIAETKAAQHAARATALAIERITYDGLVTQMEAEHPELNPDNEEAYDQEVIDELNEYKEAFEAKGHGSTEALRKALRAVFGKSGAKSAAKSDEDKDDKDDKGDEVDDEAKKEVEAKAKAEAEKRKEAAVKKGLETKAKQPADTKKAGLDSDKAGKKTDSSEVARLSMTEFEKLSEEELAQARGDVL